MNPQSVPAVFLLKIHDANVVKAYVEQAAASAQLAPET